MGDEVLEQLIELSLFFSLNFHGSSQLSPLSSPIKSKLKLRECEDEEEEAESFKVGFPSLKKPPLHNPSLSTNPSPSTLALAHTLLLRPPQAAAKTMAEAG